MRAVDPAKQWTERNAGRIVFAATAAVFVILAALSLLRYSTAGASGLDLGIYGQVLWNTAHGRWFEFSIHPHSYLGDHLELGLILLAPFAIFGTVPVLVIAQALALAAAGPLAFALARRRLPLWLAVVTAVGFLISPFIANAALFEFHFLTFALPVLLGAIVAYEARRLDAFLGLLTAALFIREDLAPVVVAFGVLAALDRRGWRWWLGPVLGGSAWFIGSLRVVAAASGYPESKFLAYYRWLGDSPGAIALNFFRQPLAVLRHVVGLSNLGFLVGSFGAFALLPLPALSRLLPAAPLFAQYLLGAASSVTLDVHYLVPFLPFLLWASVRTLERLTKPGPGRGLLVRMAREPGLVAAAVVATVMYSAAFLGPFPRVLGDAARVLRDPRTPVRVALARHLPPDVPLAADFTFIAPASERRGLASLHYQYRGRRQLTDVPYAIPPTVTAAAWDFENVLDYQALYRDAVKDGTDTGAERLSNFWTERRERVIAMLDTYALTEQSDRPSPLPYVSNPPPQGRSLDAPMAEGIRLVGTNAELRLAAFPWFGRTVTTLPLSVTLAAEREPNRTLNLWFTATRGGRVVLQRILPVAYGFHPTVNWAAGERVRTDFRLAVTPKLAGSAVSIQLVRSDVPLVLDHLRSLSFSQPERFRFGAAVSLGTVAPER